MRKITTLIMLAFFGTGICVRHGIGQENERKKPAEPETALDFTVTTIEGEEVSLAEKYDGKVLLVVNVASKCGMTPQYAGLQKLYDDHKEQGLAVLGFPSNQFGDQEPGTNEQIATFCNDNYNVTFDLFSKVEVNGESAAPVYAWLTSQKTDPNGAGDITWNFEKFVIDRSGKVIGRFGPRTEPDDEALVALIEKALEEKQ